MSQLTRLWQEGLSTAEIGRRLGMSKNAVVGKAHRLSLPPRPSPIRATVTAPAPRPVSPIEKVVAITPKSAACQWPNGHPGQPGFHFCGRAAVPGKPYCQEHVARAYIGAKSRSDAA